MFNVLTTFLATIVISNSSIAKSDLHSAIKKLPPHCYLAIRDVDPWFAIPRNKHALDYGSGDGKVLAYLQTKGFLTQGVDISQEAVEEALNKYPSLTFQHIEKNNLPFVDEYFDLIVSNFVLSDQKSKKDMIEYFKEAERVLNKNGILIALAFTEEIYNKERNWGEFQPNVTDLEPARPTQILVNNQYTSESYYWKINDYKDAANSAGLTICSIHYPKGKARDLYKWKDEKTKSPVAAMLISRNCENVTQNAALVAGLTYKKHF